MLRQNPSKYIEKNIKYRIYKYCSILIVSLVASAFIEGSDSDRDMRVPTLSMTLWKIGMVNEDAARIERRLGSDPISLIELPKASDWTHFANMVRCRKSRLSSQIGGSKMGLR